MEPSPKKPRRYKGRHVGPRFGQLSPQLGQLGTIEDMSESDEEMQQGHTKELRNFLSVSKAVRKDEDRLKEYAYSLNFNILDDMKEGKTIKNIWHTIYSEIAVVYEIRRLCYALSKAKILSTVSDVLGLPKTEMMGLDPADLLLDRKISKKVFLKKIENIVDYLKVYLLNDYPDTKVHRYAEAYILESLLGTSEIRKKILREYKDNPYKIIKKIGLKPMKRIGHLFNLCVVVPPDAILVVSEPLPKPNEHFKDNLLFRELLYKQGIITCQRFKPSQSYAVKKKASENGKTDVNKVDSWIGILANKKSIFKSPTLLEQKIEGVLHEKILACIHEMYATKLPHLAVGVVVTRNPISYLQLHIWREKLSHFNIYIDHYDATMQKAVQAITKTPVYHVDNSFDSLTLPPKLFGIVISPEMISPEVSPEVTPEVTPEVSPVTSGLLPTKVLFTPYLSLLAHKMGFTQTRTMPLHGVYYSFDAKYYGRNVAGLLEERDTQLEKKVSEFLRESLKADTFLRVNTELRKEAKTFADDCLVLIVFDKIGDKHPTNILESQELYLYREDAVVHGIQDMLWEEVQYFWTILHTIYINRSTRGSETKIWLMGHLSYCLLPYCEHHFIDVYTSPFLPNIIKECSLPKLQEEAVRMRGRRYNHVKESIENYEWMYTAQFFNLEKTSVLRYILDRTFKTIIKLDISLPCQFFTEFPHSEIFSDCKITPLEWTLFKILMKGTLSPDKMIKNIEQKGEGILKHALAFYASCIAIREGLSTCLHVQFNRLDDVFSFLQRMRKRQKDLKLTSKREAVWKRRKWIHPLHYLNNLAKYQYDERQICKPRSSNAEYPRTSTLNSSHKNYILQQYDFENYVGSPVAFGILSVL